MPESVSDKQIIVDTFDRRVEQGFAAAGVTISALNKGACIGAAVSGGADSTALLTALSHICLSRKLNLAVVTVNHRIRPESETGGDALFVQEYCSRLAENGYPVHCRVYGLEKGAVDREAASRGRGIEEAARSLRYDAFSRFAEQEKCTCICLAHNRNDQIETLLMRFFQGSGGPGSAGIRRARDIFVRPMLDIPRCDIELYLTCQGISWRTDATNNDIHFFRNRIRRVLMPYLDDLIPGWQRAVLSGGEKAADDSSVLDGAAAAVHWTAHENSAAMPEAVFMQQPAAVRRRLLYKAFDIAKCEKRVPYTLIRSVCAWNGSEVPETRSVQGAGMHICCMNGNILVEKEEKNATQCGFFDIIKEIGEYELPFGTVTVKAEGNGVSVFIDGYADTGTSYRCSVPFCIRSRQPDDRIRAADGSYKPLNDVFSSWHVDERQRDDIPLLQELDTRQQNIMCICGSPFGYEDWIVKER